MNGFSRVALSLMALGSAVSASSQEPSTQDADSLRNARVIIGDVQRIVTPAGIDETLTLTLGDARQVVNIRGADRDNPVLIYLHGGPGSVEMPMAWTFQHPWEDFFTVVQWDQRGAGRSWPLNPPEVIGPTLSLERYRDDAIELVEVLRQRFGKRRVFLLGHSFGSTIGLAVAAKRPDLLHGYIGMGQLIDARENERVGMALTLATARERGDREAINAITALAPYPDSGPFTIEKADAWRAFANRYGSLAGRRADANFYFDSTKLSPLYTPADRAAWAAGSAFTVTTLWPRIADLSFTGLRRLDVPVMLLMGRLDRTTPSSIAAAWFDRLRAPRKLACWFEQSGHLPMIEEPGRVFPTLLHMRTLAAGEGVAWPAPMPAVCSGRAGSSRIR